MSSFSLRPFAPKYGTNPEYIVLDQENPKGEGADAWHSDNSFMSEPPMGSVLRAVLIPEVGGDTCFASTVAAYDLRNQHCTKHGAHRRLGHD